MQERKRRTQGGGQGDGQGGGKSVGQGGGAGTGTSRRRNPPKPPKEPTPLERMKLAIAAELGLAEKVRLEGWGMLTAAESGRVGGILGRRLKEQGLSVGPSGTVRQVR